MENGEAMGVCRRSGVDAACCCADPAGKHPNYDDDIRPIFSRRCFGCHNAGEMRSGLSLESFNGVLKGGNSGDAVIAGRR